MLRLNFVLCFTNGLTYQDLQVNLSHVHLWKNLDENTEWRSGGRPAVKTLNRNFSLIRAAATPVHMLHLIISVLLAGRHPQYLLDVTPSFQHALSVTAQWPGRQVDGELCQSFFNKKLIVKALHTSGITRNFEAFWCLQICAIYSWSSHVMQDVYLNTSIGYMLRL